MFYDNYVKLCAKLGKSPSGVAVEIGLSNAAANGWKKGKTPNDTTIAKLSSYFGVPVSELIGGEQKEAPSAQDGGLSEKAQELIRLFDLAPPELQAAALAVLKSAEAVQKAPDAGEGEK